MNNTKNATNLWLINVPHKLLPAGAIYSTLDGEWAGVREDGQVSEYRW